MIFDFRLNSSKQESKASVPFIQAGETKLRFSNRELSSSWQRQQVLMIDTCSFNFSPFHFCQAGNPSHFLAHFQTNISGWQKTTLMLAWDITKAYLIPQTPTTSSGIIILWIPIMSCFSKRKITFPWCLLWRCSSKTKRSYIREPTM